MFFKDLAMFYHKTFMKKIFEKSEFVIFCIRSNMFLCVFDDAMIKSRCDWILNILFSIDVDDIKINDWYHNICFFIKCESHEQIK